MEKRVVRTEEITESIIEKKEFEEIIIEALGLSHTGLDLFVEYNIARDYNDEHYFAGITIRLECKHDVVFEKKIGYGTCSSILGNHLDISVTSPLELHEYTGNGDFKFVFMSRTERDKT